MTALKDTIRSMAGSPSTVEVADTTITAELARHRMLHVDLPIEWYPQISGTGMREYKRALVCAWGKLEPDTQVMDSATLRASNGTTPAGNWTLDEDGWITFTANQAALTTIYVTAYSYDIYSTAAAVAEILAANRSTTYDFSRGDQKFSRSQAPDALRALAADLRRRALPVTARRRRGDDVPALHGPGVQRYRSRGGNDQ